MNIENCEVHQAVEVSGWDTAGLPIKGTGEFRLTHGQWKVITRANLFPGALIFLRTYSLEGPCSPFLRVFRVNGNRRARRRGFRVLTVIPVCTD